MPNQVRLHDQYVEIICVGDQTNETVRTLSTKAAALTKKAWGNRPGLVFVDLCRMGKSSFSSREAAMEALQSIPFAKIAICADSLFLRHVAQLIVRATGMIDKIRIFPDNAAALNWLLPKTKDKRSRPGH